MPTPQSILSGEVAQLDKATNREHLRKVVDYQQWEYRLASDLLPNQDAAIVLVTWETFNPPGATRGYSNTVLIDYHARMTTKMPDDHGSDVETYILDMIVHKLVHLREPD